MSAAANPGGESAVAVTPVAESPGLARAVAGGVGWKVASQVVVQVTRLVVGIALARLLTPRDFGLAALALALWGLIGTFTDLSLGAALVQRREIDEDDRSTVFWTSLAVGLVATALGVALAGPVGGLLGSHEAGKLFRVLALGFTIGAASAVPTALLTRSMSFRALELREMASAVAGGAAGLALALGGFGPWAIVLQVLVGAAVSLVLVWLASAWRPRFAYSRASLHHLGSFGLRVFGSRVLAYLSLNADNFLVGRVLGATALGPYSLAFNVMFTPMLRFVLPIQQVVFPAFSRLQDDDERLREAWLRSKRLMAALLAPAFLGMIVTAPDLIPTLFGAKWHAAIRVLQLLAVAGVAHSLVTLNWSALQARGRTRSLLWLNVLATAVTVGAFAAGLPWGIVGVAAFFAGAKWLLVLPDTLIASRAIGVPVTRTLAASVPALVPSLGMTAVALGARLALVAADVPAAARLAIVVVVGALAYLALSLVAAPETARDLRRLVRRG